MIQVQAQWAGHHLDKATGTTKVWAACWGTEMGHQAVYMAIWRHDPDSPRFGQKGFAKDGLLDSQSHYLEMVRQKERKGYQEIEFEQVRPEYVPSFRQRSGQEISEAMAIAMRGYPAFRPKKGADSAQQGADLPLVGLQVALGADLDPDPVRHGEKFLALLRSAGGSEAVRQLLLGYQRAQIRLEVQSEFGRRKAERVAALVMLSSLRSEMQAMLVG